jgi:RNA polymerase sigma factor (sigma-70 family)
MDQNNTDDELDDNESEQVSNTSYDRPPELESALAWVMAMSEPDLFDALGVKAHATSRFIPSEVLVTLTRLKFGSPKAQKSVALTLHERIVKVTMWYLRQNPQWAPVIERSSESKKELISDLWVKLMATRALVSFAEVRFLPFLESRILDWLKSQLRQKNSVPAAEDLESHVDDNDDPMSLVDMVPDDAMPVQDQVELKELLQRLELHVLKLPKKFRDAVYYCFELEITQEEAAKLMKCSARSVRTYLNKALDLLRKGA